MGNYRIADLSVNMQVTGRTWTQSEKFMVSEQPDEHADIEIADMTAAIRRGMMLRPASDPENVELIVSGKRFYKALIDFDGFMLHASAVVYQNKAYLFSADSGVGKSTHTLLWTRHFKGAYILNDDKPALRFHGDKVMVYGTPWNGKWEHSVNESVALGGICFLYRNDTNTIRRLTTVEAVGHLLGQTSHKRFDEKTATKLLKTWDKLLSAYPIYKMGCLPDFEAVELAYKTMKGD